MFAVEVNPISSSFQLMVLALSLTGTVLAESKQVAVSRVRVTPLCERDLDRR